MNIIAAAASVLSIAGMSVGAWFHDWVGATLCVYALVFSLLCIRNGSGRFAMFCLASSVLILVGNLAVSFLLPYSMVLDEKLNIYAWAFLTAAGHSICLPTMVIAAYYAVSSFSSASFNWMLVAAFATFIGIGMAMPGFFLEFIDYLLGTKDLTTNAYALYSLVVPIAFMVPTSIIAWRYMRPRRYLIVDGERRVRQ
jgi:hypothetical protein